MPRRFTSVKHWHGYWKIKWGWKAGMYRVVFFNFAFAGGVVGHVMLNLPKIRSSSMLGRTGIVLILIGM